MIEHEVGELKYMSETQKISGFFDARIEKLHNLCAVLLKSCVLCSRDAAFILQTDCNTRPPLLESKHPMRFKVAFASRIQYGH